MRKYTRATKLKLAKRYLTGETSTKLSSLTSISAGQICYWGQVYSLHKEQAFIKRTKPYSALEKYHILLKMVTERWSLGYTSAFYNLSSPGTLSAWNKRFLIQGQPGLKTQSGRPSMSKHNKPSTQKKSSIKLSDPTLEELKEELNYLRAENAYLKKLDALLKEENQISKKQGLSKP